MYAPIAACLHHGHVASALHEMSQFEEFSCQILLQGMVRAMPRHQLEAYPQMLLACLAALSTSSVQVFTLLLKLFCEVCLIPWSPVPKSHLSTADTMDPLHCVFIHSFITCFPIRRSGALQQTFYGSPPTCPVLGFSPPCIAYSRRDGAEGKVLSACATSPQRHPMKHAPLLPSHDIVSA